MSQLPTDYPALRSALTDIGFSSAEEIEDITEIDLAHGWHHVGEDEYDAAAHITALVLMGEEAAQVEADARTGKSHAGLVTRESGASAEAVIALFRQSLQSTLSPEVLDEIVVLRTAISAQ